ncbi:acyl-CoA dehydrogenase family protein [Saccharothrix australiensis]|uniref:Dibenzothiophene monooxygenase n=1 Tax=Saccharothrix australiensis TaxID=2072 RepID=A0A495W0P9_9PSEU|nr:acyl-CoA dehydrogenase family protein [Saccharothrix australiensis]RKT54587.1 alkylation response protein AidB-like acyl-CoA dehydrogenase [Saccharothrix australiensis]
MSEHTTTDPVATLAVLARERFAARAAGYDDAAAFPEQDFADLHEAGLLAPCVPVAHGGLGLGPLAGRTYPLWAMTRELARADLSLARCWEAHANCQVLLDALGSPEQRRRWFDGIVTRGERWAAWSGEPPARRGGDAGFGTTLTRVDGGWLVNGSKAFCTSAGAAHWAILLINRDAPGGARHGDGSAEHLLMLACDLTDPTVVVDDSWWHPIGMRATVSHRVRFEGTFIPDEHRIGPPGAYLRDGWQAAFTPHYAASFLGAAGAAHDYALATAHADDPYVQQRVGRMSINLETGDLWLRHVAELWDTGRREEARQAGARARHVVEHLAEDTVQQCVRACGARSLVRPSPVERVLRDLSLYLRHDNDDHVLATIGKALLGRAHDPLFFKP